MRQFALQDSVSVNFNPKVDLWVHGVITFVHVDTDSFDVVYDDGFVDVSVHARFIRLETDGNIVFPAKTPDSLSLEEEASRLLPSTASTKCAELQLAIDEPQIRAAASSAKPTKSGSEAGAAGADRELLDLELEDLEKDKLLDACLQFKYLFIEADEAAKQSALDKEMLVESSTRKEVQWQSETAQLKSDLKVSADKASEAQLKAGSSNGSSSSSSLADKAAAESAAKIKALQKEVADLKRTRGGKVDKNAPPPVDEERESEKLAFQNEIEALKHTIGELTQRAALGNSEKKSLDAENERLLNKSRAAETELAKVKEDNAGLAKKVEALEAVGAQLTASLEAATADRDAAIKQKKMDWKELKALQKQFDDCKETLQLRQNTIEDMTISNAAYKVQVQELLILNSAETKNRARLLSYFEVGLRCEMLVITGDRKSPVQVWSGGKLSKLNDDSTFNVFLDEGVSKTSVPVEKIRIVMNHGRYLLGDRVEVDCRGAQVPGKITKVNVDGTYGIYYDNGNFETKVSVESLKLLSPPGDVYEADDMVIVNYKGSGIWYSAVVVSVNEATMSVLFDFGESGENVDIAWVRAWCTPGATTNCQVCQGIVRIARQADDCKRYARELQLAHEMATDGAILSALEISKLKFLIRNAWIYCMQESKLLADAIGDLAKFFDVDALAGHSGTPAGMEDKVSISKVAPSLEPISRERFEKIKREKIEEERRRRLVVEEERRRAEAERRLAEENFAGDAIKKAAQKGDMAVLTPLVERWTGDPVLSQGPITPVFVAAERGNVAAVELLTLHGAAANIPDLYGNTPLSEAAGNGHEKVCAILVANGAELEKTNNDGCTPLYRAVSNGHKGTVTFLLKSGADIDKATRAGRSPALLACWSGQAECLEILMNNKCNINKQDNDKWSCLFSACANNHIACLDLLLKNRQLGDINGATNTNDRGQTPLYMAAKQGHLEVLARLLERGAHVNAVDNDGDTPIFVASQEGNLEVMELLIKNGADISLANKVGLKPKDIAAMSFNTEAVEYLKVCCNHPI